MVEAKRSEARSYSCCRAHCSGDRTPRPSYGGGRGMSGTLNAAAIRQEGGVGDSWRTPKRLWEEISNRYLWDYLGTILDPCPQHDHILSCTKVSEVGTDGLSLDWSGPTFVNPPFSDIEPWVKKASESIGVVVMLVPVRTDQPWWHLYASKAQIVFIRGRVNYESGADKTTGASFPSCLLIFDGSEGNFGPQYWWPESHKSRRKKAEG